MVVSKLSTKNDRLITAMDKNGFQQDIRRRVNIRGETFSYIDFHRQPNRANKNNSNKEPNAKKQKIDKPMGGKRQQHHNGKTENFPILVCFHKNMSNVYGLQELWELDVFQSWRVIAIERRGCGKSSHNKPLKCHEDAALDMIAVLEHIFGNEDDEGGTTGVDKSANSLSYEPRNLFFLGWETGGCVALEVARSLISSGSSSKGRLSVSGIILYASIPTRGLHYGVKSDGSIMSKKECDEELSRAATKTILSKSAEDCCNYWNTFVTHGKRRLEDLPISSVAWTKDAVTNQTNPMINSTLRVIRGIQEQTVEACQNCIYHDVQWRWSNSSPRQTNTATSSGDGQKEEGDEAKGEIDEEEQQRQLEGLECPILILHGDKDKYIPLKSACESLDDFQSANIPSKLVVVPGGTHNPVWDGRNVVRNALSSFVSNTNSIKS